MIDRPTLKVPPNSSAIEKALTGRMRVTYSIIANACLALVKVLAGITGNSYALVADGVESMLDVISSLAVWGSLKIAVQPADERFPYGYGKIEPLATLVVSLALFVAAISIGIQSIREIQMPHHAPARFTLVVLVAVVLTKELMYRYLLKTGSKVGSRAITAEAWHQRSDALTSLAAFIGISVALIAGERYASADDWAALVACVVILYNGTRLARPALREILDAAAPVETDDRVRVLSSRVDGVEKVEKCRIRKSGLGFLVDLHIEVDREISVASGHQIGHDVRDVLLVSELDILDVNVHVEPKQI